MTKDIVREKGYLTLGTRFRRLGERMQAETQTLIADAGIDVQSSHYPLLFALEAGPMTINALADALGVSQPGVTRSVAHLERLEYVTVKKGEHDKRQRVVTLSDAGQRTVDQGNDDVGPELIRILQNIVQGAKGDLFAQLEHIEDELTKTTFLERKGGD